MAGWVVFTWLPAAPSEPGTWDKPRFWSDIPGGSPVGGTSGTSVRPWALVNNLKRQALLKAVRSCALLFPGPLKVQETSGSCQEPPPPSLPLRNAGSLAALRKDPGRVGGGTVMSAQVDVSRYASAGAQGTESEFSHTSREGSTNATGLAQEYPHGSPTHSSPWPTQKLKTVKLEVRGESSL